MKESLISLRITWSSSGYGFSWVGPHATIADISMSSPLAEGISLAILTTREPGGLGAIAKYLAKFGEGNQQVEYRCANVDRATQLLKDKFGVTPVYPTPRAGADGTRVNFFLVPSPDGDKVLIELYEWPSRG